MNANGLEIEKRYLLKREPNTGSCIEIYNIEQYYTPEGRFRRQSGLGKVTYFKTNKKFVTEGVSEEIEIVITENDFIDAIKTASKSISKTRTIYYNKHVKWEVDIFKNGLIIAEVELESIADLDTVVIPNFISEVLIMDITPFREFSNFNLADKIVK